MTPLKPNSDGKYALPTVGKDYCIMYRKNESAAEVITINSQFIPSVLHAVLTVALYTGDNCNVESASKAGEVVIDIPRLQLTGAMDISMTATGAAQTPLEGSALASGCSSCDGKAVYATITKYITDAHWYDDAQGLVIEDLSGMKVGDTRDLVVYAYYANKAPKKVDLTETYVDGEETKLLFTVTSSDTAVLTYNSSTTKVTAVKADSSVLSVVCAKGTDLETNKSVTIS